ncbi:hypothetical protein Cus16_2425 [Curtobacterium sp. ER1/6]|nr:hypothetical protein Cus16_2425 [Curtobacterium sp. ER1/6]
MRTSFGQSRGRCGSSSGSVENGRTIAKRNVGGPSQRSTAARNRRRCVLRTGRGGQPR